MIDLHCHVLPGLDDGPATLAESREIGSRAAADGVTALAATPHVREDYPTRASAMEAGVEAVRADFAAHGIPVEVLHGGEIALDVVPRLPRDELVRFSLGQTGRYLLVEFPYLAWPLGLEHAVAELRRSGLTPVLAHPERNGEVMREPARLEPAVRAGALVQLTAGSLEGRFGGAARSAAELLLELRLAHLLASDAHAPSLRDGRLAAAAEGLADDRLATYLTEEAPAAVVAGEPVPDPPAAARTPKRRRFGGFRLRPRTFTT